MPQSISFLGNSRLAGLACLLTGLTFGGPAHATSVEGLMNNIIVNQQLTAIAAEDTARINDRVEVRTATGNIGSVTGHRVMLGADAYVDQVEAADQATMRDRSAASLVATPNLQQQNQVQIAQRVLKALQSQIRAVAVANARLGGHIWSYPDQGAIHLRPADYGNLKVERGVEVHLVSGNYLFEDFQVEPGGRLVLDESLGPINIAVRGWVKWAGEVEHIGVNARPLTMLFVTDSQWVNLERPLSFSVVAPRSNVNVLPSDAQHIGSVWSRSVEIHQGSVVETSTPCFARSCFWEPDPSTLAAKERQSLAALVQQLQQHLQQADTLQQSAAAVRHAVDSAQTDAQRAAVARSSQVASLRAQMSASPAMIADVQQAMQSMQAATAGNQLSRIQEMAQQIGCIANDPDASTIEQQVQQLAQQLASALPGQTASIQGFSVQAAAVSPNLSLLLQQVAQLDAQASAKAPDEPSCDNDLGVVHESVQGELDRLMQEVQDRQDDIQQLQDLLQQMNQSNEEDDLAFLVQQMADKLQAVDDAREAFQRAGQVSDAIIHKL